MSSHRLAVTALFTAGVGWGTTGLFVRLLSEKGLSIDELLFVRLIVAGCLLSPYFLFSVSRKTPMDFRRLFFFGVSTTIYYLGAITAFRHLPVFLAALIIGLSPVLAWILSFKEGQRSKLAGLGVGLATAGLLILTLNRVLSSQGSLSQMAQNMAQSDGLSWLLGVFSALLAAMITVVNARKLKRDGSKAPTPLQISMATVVIGGIISSLLVKDFGEVVRLANENLDLALGFGFFATAVPGLSIAYASVRLNPQATATVSIQLQVWAGVFAWIFIGETLSPVQILAAILAVAGSWICATIRV